MRCFAAVLTVFLLTPVFGAAQSITGVWQQVEIEVQGGDNPRIQSGSDLQGGLLIYTDRYFSWLLDDSPTPRAPMLGPTDAQVAAAVDPITAASGVYEFTGSEVRYTIFVSLTPGAGAGGDPLVRRVELLTDDRLETSGTNTETGVKTIRKYERVE